MESLQRIYQLKLAFIATVMVVVGVALMLLAARITAAGPAWAQWLPMMELGASIFTSGLVAVGFEYFVRKEADRQTTAALIRSFAFDPSDLAQLASPNTLDQIAKNAMSIQLRDGELADDLYADIKEQVISSGEQWRDLNISVSLSPWENGPASGPNSMFVATIRRQYRVKSPNPVMRFDVVSDTAEYAKLLEDPARFAWMFLPGGGLTANSKEVFELLEFTVDGEPRSVRRSERAKGQAYSVNLGIAEGAAREIVISYTYKVLIRRHSHSFWLTFAKPTKGINIHFQYAGCGVAEMRATVAIPSSQPARVVESSPSSLQVSFDGWAFLRSAVTFVWVLDTEVK